MARRPGENEKRPIIIRREEAAPSEHHGGSWKIAYADFVTAMMAFFLVMWLINATTEQQRRGIANFFNPLAEAHDNQPPAGGVVSTRISPLIDGTRLVDSKFTAAERKADQRPDRTVMPTGGLDGNDTVSGAGDRVSGEGSDASTMGRHALHVGSEARSLGPRVDVPPAVPRIVPIGGTDGPQWSDPSARADAARAEEGTLRAAAEQIRDAVAQDPAVRQQAGTVSIRVTAQGLEIDIADAQAQSMFDLGSTRPNAHGRALLKSIAPYLARLEGPIAVTGYTDATPYRAGQQSNWTLSTLRAASARDLLQEDGLAEARIDSVSGRADRELARPEAPGDPGNRRIVLTVRRQFPEPSE
ncbi:chemotaxis protein MotB [Ameyamaea chiangmaiensis NBRC 103196]|uniref:OmpA family protein n=1 Tax=Ameyamaea chiangmaiensis TaxID=442969 RepID=A0A850P3K8_9PROT|nr:flagellar motor protein MotB [Ameyamaea chiangmaiensis]MBS4074489.1 OmpA family protein [Ameyamaea chiangmaiensis]NVN39247.1 OmpA family protein [Ameyamaea chiangmaiensis]GBQ72222.1 chemotaxis protein MotB [Ameyamaea chiangmaiensis NBRC 103196]